MASWKDPHILSRAPSSFDFEDIPERVSSTTSVRLAPQIERRLQEFTLALKRRQIHGSFPTAENTAQLFLHAISAIKQWTNTRDVIVLLKTVGRQLQESQPQEYAIGNVVRRILWFIKEAYNLAQSTSVDEDKDFESGRALYNMLGTVTEDYSKPYNVKLKVLESIADFMEELKTLKQIISGQAIEHIHANEVIMTYGNSLTIMEFLKAAGRKRKFEVIVAEASPSNAGHELAVALSQANIDTTLITDSAIFAMMARVNKVIIGCHGVMANGGVISPVGTRLLAQAAKYHSVPLMICAGLYKLCPLFPSDADTLPSLLSPSAVLNLSAPENGKTPVINVLNPEFDYIPPELVSLFVTNDGGYNPSYVYRLLQDYYDPQDYEL